MAAGEEVEQARGIASTIPAGRLEQRRAIAAARERLFGVGEVLRIGRYRVERRLGAGGMGEVFLGQDEALERPVALKRILPGVASAGEQAYLREEARTLAKLAHPNVVRVYEVGEDEGGTYLAMEYIDGETLAAWLNTPRPWRAVLERFVAAGRGLAAAHEAGIVHRDFKPANVLLDHSGGVLVADFGLARVGAGGVGAQAGTLSAGGGTLNYMAPEQLARGRVDARSDQFSYCVALYEALWGEQPFTLGGPAMRLRSLESEAPAQPVFGAVPRDLWRILRRGLEHDPQRRWPNMPRLLAELERVPRRRARRRVAAWGGPLVALLVGGLFGGQQHTRARALAACELEAELIDAQWNPTRASELGARYSEQLWTPIADRLDAYAQLWSQQRRASCRAQVLDAQVQGPSHTRVAACLDHASATMGALLELIAEQPREREVMLASAVGGLPLLSACTSEAWLRQVPASTPELEPEVARLRTAIARTRGLRMLGQPELGLRELDVLLEQARALGWAPLLAEAQLGRGEMLEQAGRYSEAREVLVGASVEGTAAGHDFVALRAAIALSRLDGLRLEDAERGQDWSRQAEALLDRLQLRGTLHEASMFDARARVQRKAGELDEAFASQTRALELDEALHGSEHPDVALSLLQIGMLHLRAGRLDQAERAYRHANEVQVAVLGPSHPDRAWSVSGLAALDYRRGRYGKARDGYVEALALREAALGEGHPYVLSTLVQLAEVLRQLGEYEEALAHVERALVLRKARTEPGGPSVETMEALRGRLLGQLPSVVSGL